MTKFIVNTNISEDKVPESFTGELTQQLSKAMGKPAQYLAIQISPDQLMSFGGSTDPCAVCFLYSIGKIGEQENKVYSRLLCDLLNKQLKIPSDRICQLLRDQCWQCRLEQHHLCLRCPQVATAYT